MRMPPGTMRLATSACWSWRRSCEPRSRSSSSEATRATSEQSPMGWWCARSGSARRDEAGVAARSMAPVPGPRDSDQYNFTDPESRIMKNPTDTKSEEDYNVQVAVDQGSLLIVAWALSNHPNDCQEAEPTLAALPSAIGTPEAAALDAGYF